MDIEGSLDGPNNRGYFLYATDELSNRTATTTTSLQQRSTHPHRARDPVRCRFFGTRKGCRAGDACPYQHVSDGSLRGPGSDTNRIGYEEGTSSSSTAEASYSNQSKTRQSPVQRQPRPLRTEPHRPYQFQSPIVIPVRNNSREFQLNQIRRRFHSTESTDQNGTTLSFGMVPTDPDFPFELDQLRCVLHVPTQYPCEGYLPALKVTNPKMERGFQINVEKGFDRLVASTLQSTGSTTLLGLMNSLDRQLESLLTGERASTIKFVANAGDRHVPEQKTSPMTRKDSESRENIHPASTEEMSPSSYLEGPAYSPEEKSKAEQARNDETRQLNARLSRLPLFKKSPDSSHFVIPITASNPVHLPLGLRNVKAVKLNVPPLYPLEPSHIELQGVEKEDARPVEVGFDKWLQNTRHLPLMSQVNYLAQNLHILAKTQVIEDEGLKPTEILTVTSPIAPTPGPQSRPGDEQKTGQLFVEKTEDRSHIQIIPRPPEWSQEQRDDISSSEGSDSDASQDDASQASEEGGATIPEESTLSDLAAGVSLSFPSLELYGIELLELTSLSVTIKCDRCKEMMDVKTIKAANIPSNKAPIRVESCKKCANRLTIGYRRVLMHHMAHRAGYLDLDGCTVVDLLTSHFVPTCSECSTSFPAPGVIAVRGESAMANCRECHRRMVFKLPEVKFLVVGPSGLTLKNRPTTRKKIKENLGIVTGQELPRRGRCAHYSKSYRWFRFSCCAKVFPCDKCHDVASDHPNEHANRMICGFCSREQHYRPEDCGFCHLTLIGKAGSGFWEGGKGTRDKVRMSKKDPRKYKRRAGTTHTTTSGGGTSNSGNKK